MFLSSLKSSTGSSNSLCLMSTLVLCWVKSLLEEVVAQLEEQMSAIDLPSMRTQTFCILERKLGGLFEEVVSSVLLVAGLEEKEIATEKGEYHNNVPSITVVIDAGWSKRSHKPSYNANSGVGVTFRIAARCLLFIGVRNFCSLELEISTVLFAQLLVVKERM